MIMIMMITIVIIALVVPLLYHCIIMNIIWHVACSPESRRSEIWMRTGGVNANGAAAKGMNFDGLGKRYALALLGRSR